MPRQWKLVESHIHLFYTSLQTANIKAWTLLTSDAPMMFTFPTASGCASAIKALAGGKSYDMNRFAGSRIADASLLTAFRLSPGRAGSVLPSEGGILSADSVGSRVQGSGCG